MAQLGLIIVVVLPFVVSPGASFALTLGSVPVGGWRAVVGVLAGTAAGVATMVAVLNVTRLGEAVAGSPTATRVMALAGGAVLVGLGLHMIVSLSREAEGSHAQPVRSRPSRLLAQAYTALLLNPKALSVYLVVVPGLAVGSTPPLRLYIVFAAIHVGLLAVWLLFVAWLLLHFPTVTSSRRWRRTSGRIAGGCLILVGVTTALGGVAV